MYWGDNYLPADSCLRPAAAGQAGYDAKNKNIKNPQRLSGKK